MEENNNKMPFDVTISKATNGFVVKVGCTVFVKEGDEDALLDDLSRYYKFDDSLGKAYGYKRWAYISTPSIRVILPGEEGAYRILEKEESNIRQFAPVVGIIKELGRIKEEVYKVYNGEVVINYEDGTVLVKQSKSIGGIDGNVM